ncbi:MAG: MATE family efflux transporter [Erysipelotrichaceae bacterium]|nr:MATE family efflux transporter [Erysipelotrichaceae bacterium]
MSLRKEIEIFENYSIPKAVGALVIPTVITQIISIIYNFADTWYVGLTNNPAAIAALSVSMPIFVLMAAIANLFGIGASSVISRSLGAKNTGKARRAFSFAFWGGIAASVIYSVVIFLFRSELTYLIGGDTDSFDYIQKYMFWTMIVGSIPTVLNSLFGHLVRSVGASKQASFGMSLGGIMNIFLDPLFMFVILPKGYEVEGAAIATMLSNCCATLYFFLYLRKSKDNPVFTLNPTFAFEDKKVWSDVFSIGLPAALSTTMAMMSNISANALVSNYGSVAVAGMGIAKKINTLAFNITLGLTQGVLPLIGYNYAAKKYKRMKDVIWFTLGIAVSFTMFCVILYTLNKELLVSFFIKDEQTIYEGQRFLSIIALGVPLCSITYTMNTVFQATGQRKKAFILSILRKGFLDIPLMFFLRTYFERLGVVMATPIAEAVSAVIAFVLFIPMIKQLIQEEKTLNLH